ncbi:FKBP-type peptidyl-prolyl cis-trans isomerase [Hymenobacter sp. APR13]|uniref:FKBP-type peptidyl-prolyl cis-trans isomerase n=1 Tax=Hymenobacter sp. APR13 TaxID=1356852 RepID=UPI0009DF216A|nr:FKBP-type peptidyl-prolyl cis-trans isomerase [Hymenobacter sp. APR13]
MLPSFLRTVSSARYLLAGSLLLSSGALLTACNDSGIDIDALNAQALLRQKQVRTADSLAITKYIADSSFTTARRQPSGLYIITKTPGTGNLPTAGQQASVVYKGSLISNNQVFDKSRIGADGQPVPFVYRVGGGQVITGWELGIAQMRKGEKAILLMPSELAYGPAGANGVIPPDAPLRFDVELTNIQ